MDSRLVSILVGAIIVPTLGLGGGEPPTTPTTTPTTVSPTTGPTHVAAAPTPVELGQLDAVGGPRRAGHHGAVDDIRSAPSCATQCITSGIAYLHPDGAELVVTTDVPARIWILVTVGDQTYHSMSDLGQTSFSHVFDLEPGTYDAMAAAQDANGHTSHAWGTFVVP